MIPVRGAPVPQSRAVHTQASTRAISATSALFRGFRPASLPTATTRDRGRLALIATIRQEVLGVPRSSALDVAPKTRSSWNTRAFSRPGDSRVSLARPAAARTAAADHYLARFGPTKPQCF
jgi:hypothetical protein